MSAARSPRVAVEAPVAAEWLHRGSFLSLHSWCCRRTNRAPRGEDFQSHSEVAVVLRGAFRYRGPRGETTADLNTAVTIASDEGYESTHPLGCGDAGLSLVLEEPCLAELAERGTRRFPLALHLTARAHYLLALLDRRLRRGGDTLAVEETLLWVFDALLGESTGAREAAVATPDAARIEAAREFLARELGRSVQLGDVAAHVALSRPRLCRLFKAHTGLPVHGYLKRLRLRAALERVLDSAQDLTSVALDVGFSSHSHFTESFRREFGCTPSAARRGLAAPDAERSQSPGAAR
jgi:AraC-like DNA-binding protein